MREAGLACDQVIADTHELPQNHEELAVVATDDVIFLHQCATAAVARLAQYDAVLESFDVPKASSKSLMRRMRQWVWDAVYGGRLLEWTQTWTSSGGSSTRRWRLAWGSRRLLPASTPCSVWDNGSRSFVGPASPRSTRCTGSCVGNPRTPLERSQRRSATNLSLSRFLSPLLGVALDNQWAPTLVATDAAPELGFGVSVAPMDPVAVADLGRKSERRGDHVRLDRTGNTFLEPERPRVGKPHRLPLSDSHFSDVISFRATRPEHAGLLELRGVRLAVRWALRSTKRFHTRLLLLVDAKAALCATAKGRSGSFAFRRPLASLGAHALAAGVLLRCLYVPSEDNPADAPSRGRRKRPHRKCVQKPRRWPRTLQKDYKALLRMRTAHTLLRSWRLSSSGSSSSSSSSSSSFDYFL